MRRPLTSVMYYVYIVLYKIIYIPTKDLAARSKNNCLGQLEDLVSKKGACVKGVGFCKGCLEDIDL